MNKRPVSKHTEGPWTYEREYGESQYYAIGAPGWGSFARVVARMNGESEDRPDGLRNVQIMTVSPRMYELLVKLEQMIAAGYLAENMPLQEIRDVVDSANGVYDKPRDSHTSRATKDLQSLLDKHEILDAVEQHIS